MTIDSERPEDRPEGAEEGLLVARLDVAPDQVEEQLAKAPDLAEVDRHEPARGLDPANVRGASTGASAVNASPRFTAARVASGPEGSASRSCPGQRVRPTAATRSKIPIETQRLRDPSPHHSLVQLRREVDRTEVRPVVEHDHGQVRVLLRQDAARDDRDGTDVERLPCTVGVDPVPARRDAEVRGAEIVEVRRESSLRGPARVPSARCSSGAPPDWWRLRSSR